MSGQPWTGVNFGVRDSDRLNITPNQPFYLMHHPMGWEFDELLGEFMPIFSELKEEAGVNGVKQTPGGPDSREARVNAQDNGFTILDYRQIPYLTRWATRSGGFYYTVKFTKPKIVAGKIFWKLDTEAYNEFKKNLIKEGIIDAPDPDCLALLIDRKSRHVNRYVQNQHLPEVKKKLDDIKSSVQAMKDAASGKKKRRSKANV